jgi:phosphate transport system substrate-binding protein
MTKRSRIVTFLLASLLTVAGGAQEVKTITGAGATFPYPIYSKWAYEYQKVSGLGLNYQSIGSGGGIQQISNKTVDFGASDAVLKGEELAAKGLVQFPMVIGGVVPVVNLEGVAAGSLKLDGDTLARIFLGEIKKWNDPAIAKLNPGTSLPAKDIAVVHRADGSGTSFIFTNYLSKVSTKWKNRVGSGTAVDWPLGLGGKGNEGVANYVKQVAGAVGYVEYAYALQNKMNAVTLKNRDGQFVAPSDAAFSAAALGADWAKADNFGVVLTDQPGKDSWPITGASFILLYKDQPEAAKGLAMLKFFDWCYKNGAASAEKLDYVPIPEKVYVLVEKMWKEKIRSKGKPVWQ